MKYFNRPCGIHCSDPNHFCKFYENGSCNVGIVDEEDPCTMRKKELEEFKIMEEHQGKEPMEQELIASKMNPCYLHVTPDELIVAIQAYRKKK